MKRFFGVLASIAVALAFGIYFIHPAGNPPATEMIRTSLPQPALGTVAPGLPPSAAVETCPQDIAAWRAEVALLRAQVSALAAAGDAWRAETSTQDIAALRKEVSVLQRQVREQRRTGPVVSRGREATPAHDSRPDPADRGEAERDRQAHMAVLEANFWQEPADYGWSSEATGAVQEALASDDTLQAALRRLECRSSTCRLEMVDDTGELAKVLPVFLMQLAQTLPRGRANHVEYSDGSRGLILYMTQASNEPLRAGK